MNAWKVLPEIIEELDGISSAAKAPHVFKSVLAKIVLAEAMEAGWLRICHGKDAPVASAESGEGFSSFCFDGMAAPECFCSSAFSTTDVAIGGEPRHPFCRERNFKTVVCLPLFYEGNRAVGFIFLASSKEKPVDADWLKAVGGQVVVTAQRLAREAEMESRLKTLRTVSRVGSIISSQLTLRELTRSVVEHLGKVLKTDRVNLVLYHAGERKLEFIATFISGEEKTDRSEIYTLSDGMNSWIVKNRRPLLMRENTVEECARRGIRHGGRPAKSWLGVPMIYNGRITGVLSVQSYTQPNLYDNNSTEMLMLVAGQTAVAVENARLYENRALREKEKQRLYYSLTHDILSFVTPVSGFGEIIKRMDAKELLARKDEIGDAVLNSADRITRFVEDILLFSKIQSGKLTLNTNAVNLYRIIDQSISNFFSELNMRKLALYIEGEKIMQSSGRFPNKIVTCDMLQIERVLNNCLQNAVKHATSKVEVTTRADAEAIFCTVADDGAGMPQEFVPKVFDEYYQMEHGRKGVGLGLPSVKRIVEQHGGKVHVETDKGKGFAFTFSLPACPGLKKTDGAYDA